MGEHLVPALVWDYQHNTTEYRALQTIQRLAVSPTHRSEYTVMALEQLLLANPSAKYGLVGKISVSESITQGPLAFYDAGKVRDIRSVENRQGRSIRAARGWPR